MTNTLSRRLRNAALAAAGAVVAPTAAFAQDAVAGDPTASNAIGGLVIWLLAVGGIIAVGAMIWLDRGAQASRTNRR